MSVFSQGGSPLHLDCPDVSAAVGRCFVTELQATTPKDLPTEDSDTSSRSHVASRTLLPKKGNPSVRPALSETHVPPPPPPPPCRRQAAAATRTRILQCLRETDLMVSEQTGAPTSKKLKSIGNHD